MKLIKLLIPVLACAAVLLTGCNKDNDPDTYTVTVNNDGNGTAVADAETAEAGTIIELTAMPNTGYIFSKWTVESGGITFTDETVNPATFTMPTNAVSVKAEFVAQKEYSIYLAISYNNASSDMFVCTVANGVQSDLLPPEGADAFAGSMTVSEGKIYVSGQYFDSDDWARACYWIDDAAIKLDGPAGRDEDQTEHVESVVVSDGKVYTVGSYMNNYKSVPCYWVDGVLNTLTLPDGATYGGAYSIAVSGGKVYAGGYIYQNGKRVPGYWLNGDFVSLNLPDGANLQLNVGMGIAVSDKVYVMGNYLLNSKNYSCVWVDGTPTVLPSDASANEGAIGKSITVTGGKVYVAGYSVSNNGKGKGCYWVDGIRTDLDTPTDMYSDGWSIGIIDGKVYVGGRYYDSNYAFIPCYWFDGVRTDLDIPEGGTMASIIGMYMSE